MSFRALPRRLARPTTDGRAEAAALSSSLKKHPQQMAPLLQFPQFHPTPFPHDKFLSIKSRSLETYTKVRGDVLQRCADLCAQLQCRQKQAGQSGREVNAAAGPVGEDASSSLDADISPKLPAHPLTPHQAEELLLLTQKVEDLVHYQGFVLTDELVWRMLHLCIQCGAPQLALDKWLQKYVIAQKRGPPFPLFILEDLTATLRTSVLPRLPESGASLACSSVLIATSADGGDENLSIAFEDGLTAAQRCLRRHLLDSGWPTSDGVATELRSVAQTYTKHLFSELVWPVWQALEAMNLTFANLRAKNLEDEDEQEVTNDEQGSEMKPDGGSSPMSREAHGRCSAWLPDVAAQTLAVRTTLMSVTPLYSFHATPSSEPPPSASQGRRDSPKSAKTASPRTHVLLCNDPPFFPNETDAIVAPVRALLDMWLVLAQCAAEAKDVPLLKALLQTVCLGFLTHKTATAGDRHDVAEAYNGVQLSPVCVNEDAWCQYAAPGTEQTKDTAHQRAAERQACAMVRQFVNGSLSVLQYGLLCAEQETVLWQLHDTFALISAVAASLRNLQAPQKTRESRSVITDDARLHRMSALALVHPAPAEESSGLLRLALPSALMSSFARGQQAADDGERASATAAMHAFVCDAIACAAEDTAVHPYAEAGLYVALATGDEALLTQVTTADMEMDKSGLPLLVLHARALQAYRRAVTRLTTAYEGHEKEITEEDSWCACMATLRQEVLQVTSRRRDVDTPQEHFVETCLTVLTLGVARHQTQQAAAYVQCVQQRTATSTTEEGNYTQDGDHNAYDDAEAEKHCREAIERGWAQLYDSMAVCAQDMVGFLEQLLDSSFSPDAPASCLSPLSLSTLAILTRLGVYAEEEAQARAASASIASEEVSKPAGVSSSPLPLSTSLDRVLARMVRDTCTNLRCASAASSTGVAPTTTSSSVGNWVQWVLLTLMARRAWTDVLAVLRALDGDTSGGTVAKAAGTSTTLLCSTTVDPCVFAALYARAVEDGASSVAAFLRPRREQLFF
ncbi:hypothetical protein, conserved [Leishmania tarentolae]|uniref:Uncharacterized protein n=1 Tax=Leishmania tarentolae TaxID=5689 RepID=A0A640KWH1_LEITA|nr:hypothetical protein, conserved [Leishmania tarentolae]